jgi:hypothetical protein
MLAGNAAYDPAATWLIQRVAGTGSSGVITFSNIPQTYQHLQIRVLARATSSGNNINVTLNGNTGSNYAYHNVGGNGSIVFANGNATQTYMGFDDFTTVSSEGTGTMGVGIIDIHDYTSTTKNKTLRGFGGRDNNGSGNIKLHSGLFVNTGAITSITLTHNASSFTTASTFALYGFKG